MGTHISIARPSLPAQIVRSIRLDLAGSDAPSERVPGVVPLAEAVPRRWHRRRECQERRKEQEGQEEQHSRGALVADVVRYVEWQSSGGGAPFADTQEQESRTL